MQISEGLLTSVISTKHTVATISIDNPGIYCLLVDMSNLSLGDTIELTVEIRVGSMTSLVQAYYQSYAHVQADPAKISVPITMPYGGTFSLKQIAGTGRIFPWSLLHM